MQTGATHSLPPARAAWVIRFRGSIAACALAAWGPTVGILFLLAFPLAVVLTPLLWMFERLRGEPGGEEAGADLI